MSDERKSVMREEDEQRDFRRNAIQAIGLFLEPPDVARFLAAIRAEGLDVERLRLAMDAVVPESIPPLYWTNERLARAIAAEYARLAKAEQVEPGGIRYVEGADPFADAER